MLRRKYFAQRGTNIQTKTKGKSTLTRMNNFRRNIHPDCTNCTSGNSGAIIKNIVHHDSSSTSSAGAGNASIRLDKIKRCTDLHKDNSDTNTVRDLNYDDYIKQKKACLVFNSHTYIKDPNKCLN